jgi:hypothetical protein
MKDIQGFEGRYAVTEDGRVWSYPKIGGTKNGKWLTQFNQKRGYKTVYLTTDGKTKTMYVHTAVARTYIDNPLQRIEINHIDGNKCNNHRRNLEWSTRQENMQHAYNLGLLHDLGKGENHASAKLKWDDVNQIRKTYKYGAITQRELARKFGVNQRVIWGIVNNELWMTH